MPIRIQGARTHNLKDVDVTIGDGLTVVTGVSGSGKSSLVMDTLYHEARRRFVEVYSLGSSRLRESPAPVERITGLGPAVAVGQNLLNRNPNSTLATASGLHPFLRLLYAHYGERRCAACGAPLTVLAEDEIVEHLLAAPPPVDVYAPLVQGVPGSHRTLLAALAAAFPPAPDGVPALWVDGAPWPSRSQDTVLDPAAPHDIDVRVGTLAAHDGAQGFSAQDARAMVQRAAALGATLVWGLAADGTESRYARAPVCGQCGAWFGDLEPSHFHRPCPHCDGTGCERCGCTGLHPDAAVVRWQGMRLPQWLAQSVDEARGHLAQASLPATAERLQREIARRLDALADVGLGYVGLDRPAPTLSRGESQRVRLAVALVSRLEDMLHVLDEPTVGQHPRDVARLMPALRRLRGPVVYVEHDRTAAALADQAIDIGPGAGPAGGTVTYSGTPAGLWESDTATGRHFSLRERVATPGHRPAPGQFLTVRGADLRTLRGIDVPIPLGRLTVVTGVSGSAKSTLVEDVLVASLGSEPVGCRALDNAAGLTSVTLVTQDPLGPNTRSNPATYTKLSDVIRDLYARETGLSPAHFSFNRPEGACPTCKGLGALEVRMAYLPSSWIPCDACGGERFSKPVLAAPATLNGRAYTIGEFYRLTVDEVAALLVGNPHLPERAQHTAGGILRALQDIGLGYLALGQPSPTLSGGEAQRVKLARYLGRRRLSGQMLVLDEPTTGLHPQDIAGLLTVLDRLVRQGATIVVVEHNTDLMRAADWIVDLGPGAGPEGGDLLYAGPYAGLLDVPASPTAQALREEDAVAPARAVSGSSTPPAAIRIRGARAHNLQGVDVDIPRGRLTVVTGVSGSGKSSLVHDVLEAEARRRYLESLSLYERQGTHEGPEAEVDEISGLGVALAVEPGRRRYADRRATVGTATELSHHVAVLLALLGTRPAGDGGTSLEPRHFNPGTYAAACTTCHGLGTLSEPRPEKLIIHPELSLCGGAMYSPGFFPRGYLCKPFNGGHDMVQALAARYGFDPATTPWDAMSSEAQQAFLFGDPEPLEVHYVSRSGRRRTETQAFPGYYGWIRDWDVGGTYTELVPCPACGGGGLRPEYAAVTLGGHNAQALHAMPLAHLERVLGDVKSAGATTAGSLATGAVDTALRRLGFLRQVGLGYLHLGREAGSLSAGEAQRVQLAGLLGSGLTSLTVLMDEPTRGLHPSEVRALLDALRSLRDEGNTVVVVEHDPVLMRAADHLLDMGPGAGAAGGRLVASGTPAEVAQRDTVTGAWLRGERHLTIPEPRRVPESWMTIRNARGNNLKGIDVPIPLGVLAGVCGVSGSGKSTLIVDTLARVLAPVKHTTSMAQEPLAPGAHDGIDGAPARVVVVDQTRAGVVSPSRYLGLTGALHTLFAEGADARALGLSADDLGQSCTVCNGRGALTLDMGFMPDVHEPCETCRGTGYRAEAWEVRLHGVSLPAVNALTLDEVHAMVRRDEEAGVLDAALQAAHDVGLGYLVWRQPGYALSGGEAQRLKIARELCRRVASDTLYILDEPTLGQHLEDVARLAGVLHRLVDAGHSVLVVEHHAHLLAACDWLIELGPAGGPEGGYLLAAGTPEALAAGSTPTALWIREATRNSQG